MRNLQSGEIGTASTWDSGVTRDQAALIPHAYGNASSRILQLLSRSCKRTRVMVDLHETVYRLEKVCKSAMGNGSAA